MIYYIADIHFGHNNIIRNCLRPFENADEMDRVIIENWNRRVRPEDTVYVIGDMFFRNEHPAKEYLSELKGNKILIIGNHDHSWMKEGVTDRFFDRISYMEEIYDGSDMVTVCHYPMMTWNGAQKGSYLVYGHIHNDTDQDYWPIIAGRDHMLNAGVEVNHYTPVTLPELISNNQAFKDSLMTDEMPF